MDVQSAVESNNAQAFKEEDKFQLRIAVSTGEVAFVENDVFGQPVNLASRVQQLAQPGDVFFTDATFHAMNRREINSESLGSVDVKGLIEKVNLYRCVQTASGERRSSRGLSSFDIPPRKCRKKQNTGWNFA